ncbi:MAG: cysteine peptidase family C39 domain-containing protein [Desulfatibacillaceae bacterium]|nr:cysteine peptidase family C39 domain-containing protein [Desulfatibacillaceae bacterium]
MQKYSFITSPPENKNIRRPMRISGKQGAVFFTISIFLALGLLCGACASSRSPQPVTASWADSPGTYLLPLSLVKQKSQACCGAASLAMVASYWTELAQTAQDINDMNCPDEGFSGQELVQIAKSHGLTGLIYQGSMADINRHLAATRPVIVMLGQGKSAHFAVVAGHGNDGAQIVLHDPAAGRVILPQKDFMRRWEQAGRFLLLVVPNGTS